MFKFISGPLEKASGVRGVQHKYLFLRWGFCWRVLSRVVLKFSWDILFESFLSFLLVRWCKPLRYPSICRFHFLRAIQFCRDLVVPFRQLFATFQDEHGTFLYAKFHSYVLTVRVTVCMRVCSCFSFLANSLMSSIYIRWLIFSCDPLSLYPAVHFLSMRLSGIMTIMKSKGDSASPWKIPLFMTSCDVIIIIIINNNIIIIITMITITFSGIIIWKTDSSKTGRKNATKEDRREFYALFSKTEYFLFFIPFVWMDKAINVLPFPPTSHVGFYTYT